MQDAHVRDRLCNLKAAKCNLALSGRSIWPAITPVHAGLLFSLSSYAVRSEDCKGDGWREGESGGGLASFFPVVPVLTALSYILMRLWFAAASAPPWICVGVPCARYVVLIQICL